MKTGIIISLVLGAALGWAMPLATAAAVETDESAAEVGAEAAIAAYGPFNAKDIALADLKFVARPLVVFADSAADPNVERQLRMLLERPEALLERDIVIVFDTDPAARSEVRLKLRPRGFSLVIMDRDGEVKLRKPLPWSAREIIAAIDKFPSRRQEMLEQRPSGR
jgi:hypothetical protein